MNNQENKPKFKIGDNVIVTNINGIIDEIIKNDDDSFSYIVVSKDAKWLENHVIVEEAIEKFVALKS